MSRRRFYTWMLVNDHLPRTFPDLFLPLPAPQFATTTAEIFDPFGTRRTQHSPAAGNTQAFQAAWSASHHTNNLQQEEILISIPHAVGMEMKATMLWTPTERGSFPNWGENVIIKCTTSVCHTQVLFMHEHKALGINKSPGLLLQACVLKFPSQNYSQKTPELSAQLGMRTPLGEEMSAHKKVLAQGLFTGIHKEWKGCPNTWTKH